MRRPQIFSDAAFWARRALTTGAVLSCILAWAAPAAAQANLGTFGIGQVESPIYDPGTWTFNPGDPGALPPGVSFRLDPPPWAIGAVATVSGVATTPGTYTYTLRKNNVQQSFTMRVTALEQKEWNVPDASVGVLYTYQLAAVNAVGAATFAVTGTTATNIPPPGMTLSSSGLLSGTPTASGFYNIQYKIQNGADTIFKGVSISVYDVRIVTDGSLVATNNVPFSTTIAAAGGTAPYTFTTSFNGCGLSLSPDGVFSGTPTCSGKFLIDVTATDAHGISRVKRFALSMLSSPPSLLGINGFYGTILEGCSFGTPCFRGVFVQNGRPPYNWSVTGLPPGMDYRFAGSGSPTMWWIAPGDLELWGAPTQMGTFPITLTVTDGDGQTATNTFDLKVSPLWLWQYLFSGTIGVPYSQTLRELGGRLPYTATIVSGQLPIRLPVGLTLDSNTLTVSGTPQENGGFTVIIDFTDADGATERTQHFPSFGSTTSTVNITSGDDFGQITEGFLFSTQLAACCVPSYNWLVVGGTLPTGVTLSPSGLLSGTPAVGSSGEYHAFIRVEDATNSANFAVRQIKLVVTTLPFTTTNLPVGNVGTPYNGSLTISGATGVTWSLVLFRQMPPGLTLHSDGTVDGIPTARGFFSFQATGTDSGGRFRTVGFGINIYGPGEIPPLNLSIGTTFNLLLGQNTIQLFTTGGTAPYHYTLTPGATEVPGMRVQDGQPLPTFFSTTITGGLIGVITTPGTYTTSIRVTDAAARVFDRAITVNVSPLHLLWVTPTKATLGVPYSFTLSPFGGTSYTWSATNLPPGLTIDATGQISGTPTVSGSYGVTIKLTDLPTSNTVNIGMAITVDPFAITTGGVLPQSVIGAFYSQTLSAPGCTGTCTWTLLGGINGLTLSSAGVLSGTPGFLGTIGFSVQVSGTNGTVSKVFAITGVNATPQLLAASAVNPSDLGFGGTTSIGLFNASGGTPPYTWSIAAGSLPTGVSLQGPGETLGILTPGLQYLIGRAMQLGDYNFTLRVRDAVGATVTLAPSTWHISPINNSYFSLPVFNQQPLVYNTPYTQPLLFMGGTNSYTFANLDPMPPGLLLNSATGVVTGTPTNTGSVTTRIRATDGASNTFTAFISFNVAGPTTTVLNFGVGPTLGPFQQGNTQNFSMTPTNGVAPYAITALSALPPGFALIPTTGPAGAMLLTGIGFAPGTYSFTIQAVDSVGNVGVRTFTMVIAPIAILGSGTILEDASIGVLYSHVFTSASGASVTWATVAGSLLPPGLGISSGGVLSGTPTAAGTFSVRLAATDAGSGVTISFNLSLRVSSIAITGPAILPPAEFGKPYSYPFVATGGGAAKAWTVTGLPNGLNVDPSTGVISGTPRPNGTTTTFALVVTVTDGVVPVTRRFLLPAASTIPAELDLATTSITIPDVMIGQQVNVTLFGTTGGRPPYTMTVAPGSTLPPGLSLLSGSSLSPGSFPPGTTVLGGVATVAGSYAFDVIVQDQAGATTRRTYTINIRTIFVANAAPSLVAGTSVSFQYVVIGGNPPYTFDLLPTGPQQDMLPTGVLLSAGGLLSGIPTSTGTFRFYVRATDRDGRTSTRLSVLNVTTASGLLVGNTNPPDTPLGRHVEIGLFAFSSTGAPKTFSWSVVDALPPGLKLETDPDLVGPSGTELAGQPTVAGRFSFRLRATNVLDSSDSADHVFTINVVPMQVEFPSLGLVSYLNVPTGHVGQPYSTTIKVAGGALPYTFAAGGLMPPGLSVSPTGDISGTPSSIGNYIVPLVVSDHTGHTGNVSIGLVVTLPGAPSPLSVSSNAFIFPAAVGSPYSLLLDALLRGGEGPYTWVVSAGSLPPGLTILNGANGVPAFLAGIPTSAGDYQFSLDVTDGAGQTLTLPAGMSVGSIDLSVSTLPPGIVGTPYPSTPLGPHGGLAPFTVEAVSFGDLPVGLTLNGSAVLSGTPQSAGTFFIFVKVKDALGTVFFKGFPMTVDNAAGEAPAVRLGPNPILVHYDLGAPTPVRVPVGVTSTSVAQAYTLNLAGAPWASLSANSGVTGAATPNLSFNVSGLGVGTYTGLLGLAAPNSITKIDWAPVILTVTPAPPCTYAVDPTSGSVSAGGGPGTFGVSTGSACSWTSVASDPSWINITWGTTGKGSRSVNFTAAPNPGAAARVGTIRVNGAVYTLTQFGSVCSFAISPTSLSTTALGGSASIAVTASASSCAWPTTTGLGASPTTGSGNGSVNITIPTNPDPGSRQLFATIAGQTLTVNQSGAACTTTLNTQSASFSSAGGGNSVEVTTLAGCGYSTVLGPSWIHVASGASNSASGTLVYSVDSNSTTVGRSAGLVIGGQPFQITQEPLACSATLDTTGLGNPYGPAGGVGSIGITMNGSNCSWTASSSDSWASVTPSSGTGNGTLVVGIGSNATSLTGRSTALSVAGQTIGLSQDGLTCSYALQSATGSAPAAGGSGSVGVIAPAACTWAAVSNDTPWLSISSAGSGGAADVNFVVQANPAATPRTGSLTVAGLTYVVNQAPAPCSFALSSTGITVSETGGSDSFGFTTTAGCSPTVQSYASWLHASSPPVSGTSGTVSWTADPNTSGAIRSGVIQVGTQTFTVTQLGAACAFSLNQYSAPFGASGLTGNFVLGSPSGLGCRPTVSVDLPSIVTLRTLSGPVTNIFTQLYDVLPFINVGTPVIRRAKISFGGQIFIVKQSSW